MKINQAFSDTTQWTQIQGCFTANGGEQYITIGNFNYNVNTDTLYVGTNNPDPNYTNPLYDYSYYYIDDVSLLSRHLLVHIIWMMINFIFIQIQQKIY